MNEPKAIAIQSLGSMVNEFADNVNILSNLVESLKDVRRSIDGGSANVVVSSGGACSSPKEMGLQEKMSTLLEYQRSCINEIEREISILTSII